MPELLDVFTNVPLSSDSEHDHTLHVLSLQWMHLQRISQTRTMPGMTRRTVSPTSQRCLWTHPQWSRQGTLRMGLLPQEVKVVLYGGWLGGINHAIGQRGRSQQTDWSNSVSAENSRRFDVANGWCMEVSV